jgi:hypothetical protein
MYLAACFILKCTSRSARSFPEVMGLIISNRVSFKKLPKVSFTCPNFLKTNCGEIMKLSVSHDNLTNKYRMHQKYLTVFEI